MPGGCLGFLNHQQYDTLPETNSLHLKNDGRKEDKCFLWGFGPSSGDMLVLRGVHSKIAFLELRDMFFLGISKSCNSKKPPNENNKSKIGKPRCFILGSPKFEEFG